MNIASSRMWLDTPAQTGISPAKDSDSGAFQQLLHTLEKTMWNGADVVTAHAGSSPRAGTSHSGAARRHTLAEPVIFDSVPRPNSDASMSRVTPFLQEPMSRAAEVCEATLPREVAWAFPHGADISATAAAGEPRIENVREQVVNPITPRQPATLDAAEEAEHCRANAPVDPAHAEGSAPFRLAVNVEAGNVVISVRLKNASADDLASLEQHVLAEARKHGAREVRLVINGIAQTLTFLPGAPYGH